MELTSEKRLKGRPEKSTVTGRRVLDTLNGMVCCGDCNSVCAAGIKMQDLGGFYNDLGMRWGECVLDEVTASGKTESVGLKDASEVGGLKDWI